MASDFEFPVTLGCVNHEEASQSNIRLADEAAAHIQQGQLGGGRCREGDFILYKYVAIQESVRVS